LLAKKR
jgi:chromosome segregation ATPase